MAQDQSSPPSGDWIDFQRKYWETWRQVGQQLFDSVAAKGKTDPWTEALEHWGKALAGSAPCEVEDFVAKLLAQAKAYFRLAEEMSRTFESAMASGQSVMDWQEQIRQATAGMKQAFAGSSSETQNLMRQVMAFWELPLDTWQRTASSLAVLPGDYLQHLKDLDLDRAATARDQAIEHFLSAPGVGYTREWQEQLQTHHRLLLEYQAAYQKYAAAYAQFGQQCVEQLETTLGKLAEEGKVIGSTREFYDLWVDCCEATYARFVSTDEYSELHGQLINRLMALKLHGASMIDEALGAMNMPTQREINTLLRRFEEMRRETKGVQAELQRLREQMEQLTGRDPGKTAAASEAASRKKSKGVQAPAASGERAARGG